MAASTVAGPVAPSLVSSVTEAALQPQSTPPQPTQPSQPPQPGIETLNNKGTSPAPENNESAEYVPSCVLLCGLVIIQCRVLLFHFNNLEPRLIFIKFVLRAYVHYIYTFI